MTDRLRQLAPIVAMCFIAPCLAMGCASKSHEVTEEPSAAEASETAKPTPAPVASKPVPSQDPAATQVESAEASGGPHPALLDPAQATGTAPDEYAVKFTTTKGEFIIDVRREWAPIGADRFYNLVRIGYFDDVAFFRVVEGFMAQVGIHGDPRVNAVWRNQRIQDDPVTQSNTRGFVSFATSGPDSRVNQFFINFGDNSRLDPMGFAPFGKVRDMAVVDALYAGYGEGAPAGRGPSQQMMQMRGNPYLKEKFPQLDYIQEAEILE